MKKLELLIPPLPLTLGLCGVILLVSQLLPASNWFHSVATLEWAIAFWILSFLFVLPAAISFFKAHTTVDPRYPEKSKVLVINGLYKISRNPMYVGFWFALIGCTLFTGNVFGIFISLAFISYMNRFQIQPEERYLLQSFGDTYKEYCQQVRRWL